MHQQNFLVKIDLFSIHKLKKAFQVPVHNFEEGLHAVKYDIRDQLLAMLENEVDSSSDSIIMEK